MIVNEDPQIKKLTRENVEYKRKNSVLNAALNAALEICEDPTALSMGERARKVEYIKTLQADAQKSIFNPTTKASSNVHTHP